MAASLRRLISLSGGRGLLRPSCPSPKALVRSLLSPAYSCSETWTQTLADPDLQKITLSEFAFEVRGELEKTGEVSAVDMEVLALRLADLEEDEVEYVEDILQRFNNCRCSLPRRPSLVHAVVRGFTASGHAERLPGLLHRRLDFGLFPDAYTTAWLLDHFLQRGDVAQAAQVAYLPALQEDFSAPLVAWLSLAALSRRLAACADPVADLAAPPPAPEDEEEDWQRVKYITFPHFDDHFDITDERKLMGKALLQLSRSPALTSRLPPSSCSGLGLLGLGLWGKYDRGLTLLSGLPASGTVPAEALDLFSRCLQASETAEEDEHEVELGFRRMWHEERRHLPTGAGKAQLQEELGALRGRLEEQGRVTKEPLSLAIKAEVEAAVKELEVTEREAQKKVLAEWAGQRRAELTAQAEEARRQARLEEVKATLTQLQEREELLTYFDFEEKIRLQFPKADVGTVERDRQLVIEK